MAKKRKLDFKKIAVNALTVAGTGVAAQVVAKMVEGEDNAKAKDGNLLDWKENADIVDYGMIAAGIILPEVVKNDMVETAGNALLAVGAYRMAERLDFAGKKLKINGVPGMYNIGTTNWVPTIRTEKKSESEKITPDNVQ